MPSFLSTTSALKCSFQVSIIGRLSSLISFFIRYRLLLKVKNCFVNIENITEYGRSRFGYLIWIRFGSFEFANGISNLSSPLSRLAFNLERSYLFAIFQARSKALRAMPL